MTTDVDRYLDEVQARCDAIEPIPGEPLLPDDHKARCDAITTFEVYAITDIPRLLAALRAVVEECKYAMSGRGAWSSCRGDGHTALGENVIDAIEREIGIPCPTADDVAK